MEKLLSADEAAAITGLRPATLRKMAWQRRIRSFKVLGALRFRLSDLEQLITERPPAAEFQKESELNAMKGKVPNQEKAAKENDELKGSDRER